MIKSVSEETYKTYLVTLDNWQGYELEITTKNGIYQKIEFITNNNKIKGFVLQSYNDTTLQAFVDLVRNYLIEIKL